ncbi:Protein AATF [Papilio xuthus]|uniref:Protein AATF n=1 Tax=Papilio xuthus TaxID=66420 RepID=A0A194QGG8_PAPXU|nr:Protein AATF [Papilio xuthus]
MKLKQKKTTKTTLSEKIADALTVKPRADIEDDHVFGTKPKTLSRAEFSSSDSEDDTLISDFRKRNVNLLSEISKKYEGKVVSRKDLEKDSENDVSDDADSAASDNADEKGESKIDSESGDESDDYSITKIQKQITGTDDESEVTEGDDGEQDDGSGSDDDDSEGYDISALDEPVKESFEHMKKENISEEAKKGACVRNQLLIWEGLLEMRIHLQRCMGTANKMPFNDTFKELRENTECMEESNKTINNVATVLDKLLTIQNLLFKNFPETKSLSNKKTGVEVKQKTEESDEEIPSDTDNEEIPSDTDEEPEKAPEKENKEDKIKTIKKRKLEDYENELNTSHKTFKSFRDITIQKWNEKTRIAANIKNAPSNTILQQINYILSDRNKLIRRTQLKRTEYDIIGYKKTEENETNDNPVIKDRKDNDEYIPEIFDDSDFYHQLLRELIE